MRGVRVEEFGGPEVLRVREVPDPAPGPGEVLVRVRAVGVNPVETYIRSGAYGIRPPLPYTPGTDGAGEVLAVGAGVTDRRPGDRVYLAGTLTGAYAELALCGAAQVHALPERLSFAQGAAVNIPYATAYRALFQRARAVPGETVLVHGATGGVGVAAVQIAAAAGLRVIGTGGTPEGRARIVAQGAAHALDHGSPTFAEDLLALTDGAGVDVILEMLANVNLGNDLALLARGGRVAVIGSRGTVEINPRDAMAREAAVLGVLLFGATPAESREIHAALGAGLANGTLNPVVGREFPLDAAPAAHEAVLAPGAHGKIVLLP